MIDDASFFCVSRTNVLKFGLPRILFIQMRAALAVNSSVFRDMTPCSLADAYLRFMIPPSQAQTKYLRLLWWSRIKDHYVLRGNLGYECVQKNHYWATLCQINQFDAFQRQFRIIFAFTSNSPRDLFPSVFFKPKDVRLSISRVYSACYISWSSICLYSNRPSSH